MITGAGRGRGRAFAFALAEREFTVALTARTQAEINATAQAMVHNGGSAIAVPGDGTNRQAGARAVATTAAELGPIDLLINNAGVRTGGLLGTTDPDEERSTLTSIHVQQRSNGSHATRDNLKGTTGQHRIIKTTSKPISQ